MAGVPQIRVGARALKRWEKENKKIVKIIKNNNGLFCKIYLSQ